MANMGLSGKPVKHQIYPEQNDKEKAGESRSRFRVMSALALVSQLGLIIGVMTTGGLLLGRWADGENGTGLFVVLGTVLGLVVGLLAGYRLIRRALG